MTSGSWPFKKASPGVILLRSHRRDDLLFVRDQDLERRDHDHVLNSHLSRTYFPSRERNVANQCFFTIRVTDAFIYDNCNLICTPFWGLEEDCVLDDASTLMSKVWLSIRTFLFVHHSGILRAFLNNPEIDNPQVPR